RPSNPITFLSEIVDSTGTVDDIVKEATLVFDRRGIPSILYVNGSFRFATREGAEWKIESLKSSHGESTSGMVLDALGNPWIRYSSVYDTWRGGGRKSGGKWVFHPRDPPAYSIEADMALAPDGTLWGAARDLSTGLVALGAMGSPGWHEEYEDSTWAGDALTMALDGEGEPHLVYEIAQSCEHGQL